VPGPDPERPRDLHALMDGRASDPAAWPPPFTIDHRPSRLVDQGGGHLVRLREGETDAPLRQAS
jgi:peptide/nickel transport system ATP-binding protein